jgi:UDP-glucose 4-epimerase
MRVLVTGAAGYIGSVVTERLIEGGHEVFAIDSLKTGHRAAVHPNAKFTQLDLLDAPALREAVSEARPDAAVHLAAEALIDESIRDPGLFFRVNVTGGLNLLDAMVASGVKRIVFSSTAAVYGEPDHIPITEESPKEPVNAYGESKLQFERALPWYHRAHGIRHVSLRYFNACGATERCGESRSKETHIIPLLFEAALGRRERFSLFGSDYPTRDGTCVRDYVHVADIADAHLLALGKMDELEQAAYNIGSGSGYTNREVVDAVKRVTEREFEVEVAERRAGDPAQLVASNEKIKRDLGWSPKFEDIESMVRSAWKWRLEHPEGYPG